MALSMWKNIFWITFDLVYWQIYIRHPKLNLTYHLRLYLHFPPIYPRFSDDIFLVWHATLQTKMIYFQRIFPHIMITTIPRMMNKRNDLHMMTSWNGNIFRVTGPLCGELTGHRWIHLAKASDSELWCFLLYAPEQTVEWTIQTLVRTNNHMTSFGLTTYHRTK